MTQSVRSFSKLPLVTRFTGAALATPVTQVRTRAAAMWGVDFMICIVQLVWRLGEKDRQMRFLCHQACTVPFNEIMHLGVRSADTVKKSDKLRCEMAWVSSARFAQISSAQAHNNCFSGADRPCERFTRHRGGPDICRTWAARTDRCKRAAKGGMWPRALRAPRRRRVRSGSEARFRPPAAMAQVAGAPIAPA